MCDKYENYTEVSIGIENEGLGYFVMNYTSPDSMPDKEGEELFKKAQEALRAFEEYVEKQAQKEEKEGIADKYY